MQPTSCFSKHFFVTQYRLSVGSAEGGVALGCSHGNNPSGTLLSGKVSTPSSTHRSPWQQIHSPCPCPVASRNINMFGLCQHVLLLCAIGLPIN